jgi:CDP-diacylglycerol--glycerol-3-phosphate 3-phosphatidyltransferase
MRIHTVANWITLGRFGLYLLILVLLLGENQSFKMIILPLYLVVFLMDKLDGWAARKFNQCTDVGVALDRAVDRIIVTTLAFVYIFFIPDKLMLIILMTNLMRDFLVSGLRQLATENNILMSKHPLGKLKFVVENIMVILMISVLTIPALAELSDPTRQLILISLVISSVLGWWSFGQYTREVFGNQT